jgi:hypothetical protein
MTFVGFAFPLSCDGKGLTGTRPRPDGSISPSSKTEGLCPPSNAGKEVDVGVGGEFVGLDISNGSGVHIPIRYEPGEDQLPQPSPHLGAVIVVVRFDKGRIEGLSPSRKPISLPP